MTISISNAYVTTFNNNVIHLSQQKYSKLLPYVMTKGEQSKQHNWDRLGAGPVNDVDGVSDGPMIKGAPQTATPLKDSPWDRRASFPATLHTAESIEQEDPVQMLIDPLSAVTNNIAMTMARGIDDIIIAAALGVALDETGGSIAFPTEQTIGDGSADLSIADVIAVQKLFMYNDVDESEAKIFVVGPYQWAILMGLAEVQSNDFQYQKALATGVLPNFMGFTWIVSTRLTIPLATELNCFAMCTSALGLNINKNVWTRVAEDPTRSFMWIAYAAMTMGCVRVEDEKVVRVHTKDDGLGV